jgi:hypothetical protein
VSHLDSNSVESVISESRIADLLRRGTSQGLDDKGSILGRGKLSVLHNCVEPLITRISSQSHRSFPIACWHRCMERRTSRKMFVLEQIFLEN